MLRPYNEREVTFGLGSKRRIEAQTKESDHKVKMTQRRIGIVHSVMMRSAHSTRPTKIVGLPNLAPH